VKALRLFLLMVITWSPLCFAQLTIQITEGQDNPTSIAVVPFEWRGKGNLPEDIPAIVAADLQRVGQFSPVAEEDMLGFPHQSSDVYFRDWRAIGAEYVLVGRVTRTTPKDPYVIQYELMDIYRQERLLNVRLRGGDKQLRDIAHKISDEVYEKLTGIRGAFSTRILFVAANNLGKGKFKYQLKLADSDGSRARTVLESNEPILSPTWSPSGREIAYVSFETSRPAIYRHEVATGRREKLTSFPGINSAPAWSPKGRYMAMVLSKDGSPDIYVMDLGTRQLKKVASHYAIDTEPAWMPDGKSLIFTSDRGGKPQIYKVNIASDEVERLTFEGNYNARARYLPERNALVLVHRGEGERAFHIAIQSLETGSMQILSRTELDESPSVAPNGAMLMYATQYEGRGILAAVSVDGRVKFRLPSSSSDVREPAWSPYLK
jgi:TolB protein